MNTPGAWDDTTARVGDAGHPAPHAGRVSLARLAIGLMAAPAAWAVQLLLNAGFAEWSCYPHDLPLAMPAWAGLHETLLMLNVAMLLTSLAGGLIAWRTWARTRRERPGSAHDLVASGEGRTRFMALAGMMTSALFAVAIVLAMVNLGLSGCGA